MMEVIGTKLALNAVSSEVGAGGTALAAPDARAAERFAEIMQAGPVSMGPVTAAAPEVLPAAVSTATTQTIGDKILGGLSSLSTDFQQSWKSVAAVVNNDGMVTTNDMLKLQMNLTQMSVQYDLLGKAISRSTQNVEQLVKIQ
jgi:type III secretion protein I